jgi:hypothetical protein
VIATNAAAKGARARASRSASAAAMRAPRHTSAGNRAANQASAATWPRMGATQNHVRLRVPTTSASPSPPATMPLIALACVQTCMRSTAWNQAARFSVYAQTAYDRPSSREATTTGAG